jgi:hypothetical protein
MFPKIMAFQWTIVSNFNMPDHVVMKLIHYFSQIVPTVMRRVRKNATIA